MNRRSISSARPLLAAAGAGVANSASARIRRWLAGMACALAACSAPGGGVTALPDLSESGLGPGFADRAGPLLSRIGDDPSDPEAAGQAGMLLMAFDQHSLALAYLERANSLAPESFRWEYFLGVTLASLGRHADAVEALRRAASLDPTYGAARVRLAESALDANDPATSLAEFRGLLAAEPDSPRLLYGAGRAAAAAGSPEVALARLRRAVELAPESGSGHYALAMVAREAGLDALAARHLDRFRLVPSGPPALEDRLMAEVRALRTSASEYLRRGVEARDSGHRAEAIRLHRRAVEEDPTLSQAHVNLVILYGTEGRAADAERQYREAAESGAESAELHYNFGVVAYSGGQPAVAKRAFRDALTMNPEHALANHNMGQMHEEEGRFAEAMASYRRALEAQPAHALSHYKIGMLWSRERNAPEAVRSFEAAIGEDSDRRPTYLYSLAAALLASGNRAAAAQRFREARREAARYQQPELARQAERALVAMGVGTDARSR